MPVPQPEATFTASIANGSTTVFPYGFMIASEDDLSVTLDGVLQTNGYTVSGVGNPEGGDVTFSVAPAADVEVVRFLDPALSRETNYQQFGDFNNTTVNLDFDRLWLAMQFLNQNTSRSLKLPVNTAVNQEITESPATRANKGLRFDASGNLTLSAYDPDAAQESAQAAALEAQTAAAAAEEAANAFGEGGILAVDHGGTGATTQTEARANLGAQESLVSGTNIKTLNGESLLGSGNLVIDTSAGLYDQLALTNLRLMLNTGVTTGALAQGRQWEFSTDEWGASSTGEAYVSGSPSYYAPLVTYGATQMFTGGTASATSALGGYPVTNAFDNNAGTFWLSATTSPSGDLPQLVGYDLGAGNAAALGKFTINVGADGSGRGLREGTIYGSNTAVGSGGVLIGSVSVPAGTTAYLATVETQNATSYRYYWLSIDTSWRSVGASAGYIIEFSSFETASISDATLIPPASVSVASAPAYISAFMLYKDDSGSAVLGTDFTVELSRDGGTTYTTATITTVAAYDGTYSAIKARADVSAQPTGTSMLMRIKTLNSKVQRIAAPAIYAE